MDIVEGEVVYTDNINDIYDDAQTHLCGDIVDKTVNCSEIQDINTNNGNQEKTSSAVWTTDSVLTLLRLYESKLEMLEHPKKKTRIWIAVSDNLKDYDIEMTPDQVRWKINALTKRYKQCFINGHHNKFKYFKECHSIFSQYKLVSDTFYSLSDMIQKKNSAQEHQTSLVSGAKSESRAIIELRKKRLAEKIESDRSQSKVKLEKQWLEYLKRQEEQRLVKDEIFTRKMKLREEELELRKRELEMREALELRRLQLKEKEQEELIRLEREKCEILKKIVDHRIL